MDRLVAEARTADPEGFAMDFPVKVYAYTDADYAEWVAPTHHAVNHNPPPDVESKSNKSSTILQKL